MGTSQPEGLHLQRVAARIGSVVVAVLLTSSAAGADEKGPGPASGGGQPTQQVFDCVIEPHARIKVGSPAAGVIEDVRVDRSDFVKSNQVLANLESSVERASVNLANGRAQMRGEIQAREAADEYGRRAVDRQTVLYSQSALSQQSMDETGFEADVAAAHLRQALDNQAIAELELSRAKAVLARRIVRSPIDGIVVDRMVQPGERVDEAPIFEIAQIDPLSVEVIVPTELFGRIEPGMSVEVMPEEPIGGVKTAEVVLVDRMIDAASGTFRVRANLPNPDLALPGGLRCQVRFELGASIPAAPR